MKTNEQRHLLILTCTVCPQVNSNLVRSDREQRLKDYITSLANLQKFSRGIKVDFLVAENSNSVEFIHCKFRIAQLSLDFSATTPRSQHSTYSGLG